MASPTSATSLQALSLTQPQPEIRCWTHSHFGDRIQPIPNCHFFVEVLVLLSWFWCIIDLELSEVALWAVRLMCWLLPPLSAHTLRKHWNSEFCISALSGGGFEAGVVTSVRPYSSTSFEAISGFPANSQWSPQYWWFIFVDNQLPKKERAFPSSKICFRGVICCSW